MSGVLSEMFYPSDIKCIVCDEELPCATRYMLCDKCKLSLNTHFCLTCGRAITGENNYCGSCFNFNAEFSEARSAFMFQDSVRELIHKLKYGNARFLAETVAEFMVDTFYEAKWDGIDLVTYVPLHKKRQKQRGYNQAELLAKSIAEKINLPLEDTLEKVTHTKNMAKLKASERAKLIAGSFSTLPYADIKGKTILLIDDVLTTGMTANECAKQLKHSRCAEVYVLTAASVKVKQLLTYAEGDNKALEKHINQKTTAH